ncbi:MAG TPA: hypothetical protein VE978_16955 [Chitinophagales bacterium]|nr:hypothetical protein [Chitinophagales bacterium]
MKLHKFLMATLIFSGSILAFSSTQASASRVRTVPSSTEQKKKDSQKSNPVKQPATNTATTQKNCNQSKLLKTSLWIGNGGTPK